jgi:hypothetical protein
MDGIKIHLDAAEQAAVRRHAEALGVNCEDIAYVALKRLMLELKAHEKEIDQEIVNTRDSHHPFAPLWNESDSIYRHGSGVDDASMPSGWFR